jgi:hypothetical protein
MSPIKTKPMPPAGRVLGEALRRLPSDKMFWSYAGPLALALAALAAFLPRHQTAAATIVFFLTFDHWLKRMLMPDWKERVAAKMKSMRSFSWAFFGFCLLYGLSLTSLPIALAFATGLSLKSFADLGGMLALIVFQAITMIVLAVVFGSTLLFLPARSAGLDWNIGDAVRSADGARGTLIAVALTCTAVSIGGTVLGFAMMLGWIAGGLPESPWLSFVGRAVIVFADMVALYVAAYCLGRLFIARTGWTPSPLPGDRIEPSLTA